MFLDQVLVPLLAGDALVRQSSATMYNSTAMLLTKMLTCFASAVAVH